MTEQITDRRIGVVLLDFEHYRADRGDFLPSDIEGLGTAPPGFFESPATWPLPTSFVVARGATAWATISGKEVARRAFANAANELRERCDIVISDCGFMLAARQDPNIELPSGVFTSGLELVTPATELVHGDIGIITFAKGDVERLLADHPAKDRVRIVETQHLPGWKVFADDAMTPIDMPLVEREFASFVRRELEDGQLAGVEALVLECSVMPQLRPILREITALPIYDVKTYAMSVIGG